MEVTLEMLELLDGLFLSVRGKGGASLPVRVSLLTSVRRENRGVSLPDR